MNDEKQSNLPKGAPGQNKNLLSFLIRLVILTAINAVVIWFSYRQALFGNYTTVVVMVAAAMFLNFALLINKAYPLRWMAPGLVMLVVFSIYPNILTAYVGFTNYGTGHLLTENQAIEHLERRRFLPEGGEAYHWSAYKSDEGEYLLWLQAQDGAGYLARVGEPLRQVEPGEDGVGELDDKGIPVAIEGFSRLNAIQAATDPTLSEIKFGPPEKPVQVRSPQEAAELEKQYSYDLESNLLTDHQTGDIYTPIDGTFTSEAGDELKPGFRANIGPRNFINFLTSPSLQGPLLLILMWNFLFPTLAVITQFGLGLFIAMLYNDPNFPGKKLVRTFLLIPFAIPSIITILMWRGMLNTEFGVINRALQNLFGISPDWFLHPWLSKGVIVVVALWLGFPYFMLICSGALQSISEDVYAAAKVDGASAWQRFRFITLPLLLVAVGPLLLASYISNFNNFNLMFLMGGPPISGATTPANHTDILISYVYRLAFEGGRGQNYGLASAITIVIFMVVGLLTLIQFRYTRMWEEVSENV